MRVSVFCLQMQRDREREREIEKNHYEYCMDSNRVYCNDNREFDSFFLFHGDGALNSNKNQQPTTEGAATVVTRIKTSIFVYKSQTVVICV